MTISDYIKSQHMSAEFFTVSKPGHWQGKLAFDEKHWNDIGIFTVEELKNYLDECSKPSAADEYYYWMEEMNATWEAEERKALRKERIEKMRQRKKYVKAEESPMTYNPFVDFFSCTTNKN